MIKSNIMKLIVGLAIFAMPFVASAELVNINNASAEALSHHLKGIGAKKALSIVEYREANGDFEAISDITNVKGIGEGLLKKNLEDMSLTKGAVKLVKGAAKDKVVVIGSKKTTKAKGKLEASNKIASNAVIKTKQKPAKMKKAKVKSAKEKQAGEKKSSDSSQ